MDGQLQNTEEVYLHEQAQNRQIIDENEMLRRNYQYDNEWIKFLAQLAENDSIKDIVNFINLTQWTDRQKIKIEAFCKVTLGRGLSTTYLTGMTDYRRLMDDFEIIEAELLIGMTRFDVTPEFNLLVDMVKMHFGLESRRSKGGHFVERIGTQRTELVHDEIRRNDEGFKGRIKSAFEV